MTALRHRSLLVCSPCLPQPDGDRTVRRLFRFVKFLRLAGCSVTCVAESSQGFEEVAGFLTDMGARVSVGAGGEVERLASAEFFDWVLCSCSNGIEPLIARLRTIAPATKIVVDAGPVEFLRPARRILQEPGGRCGEEYGAAIVRELAIYAAADAVLAASRQATDLIASLVGDRRRSFFVPESADLAVSPFPFRGRRGMFLMGDFAHEADVEALAFLGDEILPHVDPALLADNPLYVAGRNMTDDICEIVADWPTVRMVGWVHSVVPYLQRVRASLFPHRQGAGAMRRMIQTLLVGTPAVTTSLGSAVFPLTHEREALVADDPVRFAAGISRLLTDEPLWNDLARVGRETIAAAHSQDAAGRLLVEALVATCSVATVRRNPTPKRRRMSDRDYDAAVRDASDSIVSGTPPGATVAVVSRGDEAALKIAGRTGWHFPLGEDGEYTGFHPANGSEAVAHLEAVRERGADFLAIPVPSAWWLGYYGDLRTHIETHYRVIHAAVGQCVLVSLREPPTGTQSLAAVAAEAGVAAGPSAADPPVTITFEGLTDRHTVTRSPAGPPPAISVVIATHNRAALLAEALDSLVRQTVAAAVFEVVVVSAGSTDGTADVCRDLARRLRLTLVESPPAGPAVARNLAVDAAVAPLVLFFDDGVAADSGLVAAHLAAHRRYPLEHVAALGATTWHPRLPVTEVMRFIADAGYSFSGGAPPHAGQLLDHTYFWDGRSSCKKSLLMRAGGFRPDLTAGLEHVEAGYRIGRMLAQERSAAVGRSTAVSLTVVYCSDAVQHALQPMTYEALCRGCEQQGRSLWQFGRIFEDVRADGLSSMQDAGRRWELLHDELAAKVARVHELEREVAVAGPDGAALVQELHALYRWTVDAFKTKGIVEAAGLV